MDKDINFEVREKFIPNLYFFEYKGHILGLDKTSNGMFEVNVKEGTVELKGIISKVYGFYAPFSKVIVYENSLIFVPFNYNKLLIYHIIDDVWDEFELEAQINGELFLEAFLLNNIVYLLPFNYEQIIKINLDSKKVQYVDLYKKYQISFKKQMFIKYLVLDDKSVILPIFSTNMILRYYVAGWIEKIELSYKNFQINSITRGENYIYLASKNSLEILKLNLNIEIVDCLKLQSNIVPINIEYTYFDQSGFEFFENQLYCFPARWNHVVKIDVETGKSKMVEELDFLSVKNIDSEKISKFGHGIVLDNKLYIQNFDEKILVFDLKDETFQIISTKGNDPKGINFKSFIRHIINL